jgi:glutathione S-transferase
LRLSLNSRAATQSPGYPKAFAQALHFARSPGRGLAAECVFPATSGSGGGMEKTMSEVTLFGFPRSVYVQMAGLVLTHKEVPYDFHDLETEMNRPSHLALHPFERVPILRHGDFTLYETAAIASYVDDAFDGPRLTPDDPQRRGQLNQWISAVNGYYYLYLIYHVSHERNVFPQLGIPSDEEVVAHAMPKVEIRLQVLERELSRSAEFLLGPQLSLADFFMLPIIHAFGFSSEAQALYPSFPAICAWRERMEALPTLKRFRAAQPPRGPIEHARKWVVSHRPKY